MQKNKYRAVISRSYFTFTPVEVEAASEKEAYDIVKDKIDKGEIEFESQYEYAGIDDICIYYD